ncbi:hypothetical protein BJ944DRAFT_258550 [Cunninghamella echinulata]|nr:hypothetical protein BJ944DRAFT_258550 [Cunninghamella echinulata]
MDSEKILTMVIYWVRMGILILSIFVMIASLNRYSQDSIPLLSLLHHSINKKHVDDVAQSIIQDRRLIATLVACQASIFCPLFLLAGNQMEKIKKLSYSCSIHNNNNNIDNENRNEKGNNHQQSAQSSTSSSTFFLKGCIDIFCQFLMSVGLAITWMFCISFDQKIQAIDSAFLLNPTLPASSLTASSSSSSSLISLIWNACSISNKSISGLKYIILFTLMVEMIIISLVWLQYCINNLFIKNKKNIELLPTVSSNMQ